MRHITMSKKEREQLIVFARLKTGMITQREAAARLKMTPRWIREKLRRYNDFGDEGLVHRGRGKQSPKRWNPEESELMLSLLRSQAWEGFGPTFTTEKLLQIHGIKTNKETVRQAMIKGGVWQSRKQRRKYRKRRERKLMLGLMVQLDGSPHDWFEGRGPYCTLLVFIDDATSNILWLEFAPSESINGVMRATINYIRCHGVPHKFYVDNGSVFNINKNNEEKDKKTHWELAVEAVGSRVSHAGSPQAKGRVERSNGTMQDRLCKEMRLAGVSSIEEANRFLREGNFIADHNAKFAVPAAQKGDAHMPANYYDLESIFCVKEERVLANDYTITFNKQIFQLKRSLSIRPKDRIRVSVYLDGAIKLGIRNVNLEFEEVNARPIKTVQAEEKIVSNKPFKPCENSRRWGNGLLPIPDQARVVEARPAGGGSQVEKRN